MVEHLTSSVSFSEVLYFLNLLRYWLEKHCHFILQQKKKTLLLTIGDPKTPYGVTLSSLPVVLTVGGKGKHILHIKVTV